jgi:hypothetical protein
MASVGGCNIRNRVPVWLNKLELSRSLIGFGGTTLCEK